ATMQAVAADAAIPALAHRCHGRNAGTQNPDLDGGTGHDITAGPAQTGADDHERLAVDAGRPAPQNNSLGDGALAASPHVTYHARTPLVGCGAGADVCQDCGRRPPFWERVQDKGMIKPSKTWPSSLRARRPTGLSRP